MKTFFSVLISVIAFGFLLGCGSVSDDDVEKMCRKLGELRKIKEGSASVADTPEELERCKADKLVRNISKSGVECRLAAPDVDAFWNKCR